MPNSKPSSLVVGPLQGRTPSPLNAVGEDLLVKAAGADTMQQFAFFHLTVPNMSGPPLHVHTREDELFYVLDGELVFKIADQRVSAPQARWYLPLVGRFTHTKTLRNRPRTC